VFWNVWEEEGTIGPRFVPVPSLKPATDYLVVVDLATLPYVGTVSSQPGSVTFDQTLAKWVLETNQPTLQVKTILLVGDLFEPPQNFVSDLTINLDKLRKRLRSTDAPPADAFATLKTAADPDFFLGRVSYAVKTRARSLGATSIGLSIWAGGIPVDEVSVPLCVSTDAARSVCENTPTLPTTLNGMDSFRIADEGAPTPDASLHFVDLDGLAIRGVFHRNDCSDCPFVTWSLNDRSFVGLHDHLVNTTMAGFQDGASDQQRLRSGTALYNVLFPGGTVDRDAAQRAFDEFVEAPRRPEADIASTPSIFVRMIGRDADSLIVPFGMTATQLGGGVVDFLGNRFRIEMPLRVQNYQPDEHELTRWFLVAPSASRTDELGDARKRAGASIDKWTLAATQTFSDMTSAADWIGAKQTEPAGSALVVLSHHDNDRLFFDDNDQLRSDDIVRTFARPSAAILDGCGTGAAAGRLIQNLNDAGFSAIIATATPASPQMAGDFLACLADTLDKNQGFAAFTLAHAFHNAVVCVRDEKKYGARALTWLMLGNGSLRLRSPRKEP
jgi:hypothetical protein